MPAYSDAEIKGKNNNQIGGFGIVGEKKNFDGGPRGKVNKQNDKSPKRIRENI